MHAYKDTCTAASGEEREPVTARVISSIIAIYLKLNACKRRLYCVIGLCKEHSQNSLMEVILENKIAKILN